MEALINENDNRDIYVQIVSTEKTVDSVNDTRNTNSSNISNNSKTGNSHVIEELISTVKNLSETGKNHVELIENRINVSATAGSEMATASTIPIPFGFNSNVVPPQSKITAGMFPYLHPVSTTQRNNIKEGKYINLAPLLITPIDSNEIRQNGADGTVIAVKTKDQRLQRDLSLQEFIEGFNIYKNVVCEVVKLRASSKTPQHGK